MFDKPNKSDQKQTEAHTFKNDNTFTATAVPTAVH